MAVAALLIFVAIVGRQALPGDSLYPVRKVLRSAGLADAPTSEMQHAMDDAGLLVAKAQSAFDRGATDDSEAFAVEALMTLGRCEGYLDELNAADQVRFEGDIDGLRAKAVALIRLGATVPTDDHGGAGTGASSGRGSDDASTSGSDDNSGSGSSDSGTSGSSDAGSGSDDSGSSGSDSSGSGSGGSGSDDSSGNGSGTSDSISGDSSGSGDSTSSGSGSSGSDD
jgi:hypothetical protein